MDTRPRVGLANDDGERVSSFSARLRLPGQSRIPLGVEVDISDELLTLNAGDRKVAQWSLRDIDIDYLSDGFHIWADDEEVVLSVTESNRFASELGVTPMRPAPRAANAGPKPPAGKTDDLRHRISEIATALTTDSVAPDVAFAKWLGLLKELNTLHVRGLLSTPHFHELNTGLLDLIPSPERAGVS
jgi:hypothetical protein